MDLSENICTPFKLPIQYVSHKRLDETLLEDLEMKGTNNIIHMIMGSKTQYGKLLHNMWSSHYTTNISFLKDFQKLMKRYKPVHLESYNYMKTWNTFKKQTAFKEKYAFLEWGHLDVCNRSSQFMQFMSIYNLSSPILNLSIPFFFLLFPFILIKFIHKVPITFSVYKKILIEQLKQNVFGKFIQEFSTTGNWDKKIYTVLGVGFYFFSIYQNVLSCIRFYNNIFTIQRFLYLTKQHISYVLNVMSEAMPYIKKRRTMKPFYTALDQRKNDLYAIFDKLQYIKQESFEIKKFSTVGTLMSDIYTIFYNESIDDMLCYSFGFLGFIENMNSIHTHITDKQLHKCSFGDKTILTKQYYLPLMNDSTVVKNNIDITTNNYIITGPNASGKTTLLKTTLINLIMSQQLGFGCYKRASIVPYDSFYSYLNIPDTSGRDSLFQAEARRCLDILHIIQKDPTKRHFCIFDELYSGTNPYEAISSAKCYLEYLSQQNVSFLLTTHYYKLCELETTNLTIRNKHMFCIQKDNGLIFTYQLRNNMSCIQGGFKVLHDMKYPEEILKKLELVDSFN